ncbi:isopeptide-forming domain-containing fimbrial protein [Clostridium perfringens]|uniref:isopeptide-forming domain-containing fimbrial protein n=1 Tax=Clostridium perfringens TaxID=1502 RepID=UPI003AFF9B5A
MDKRNFLIKKMISLLAVFAMFLSFGSPLTSKVVKAAGQVPSDNDTALGTVHNVAEGSTVTAYQIVKGNYNENGFIGYVFNSALGGNLKIADPTKPTQEEILAIAKDTNALNSLPANEKITMTPGEDKTTYTANLNAGYWLVIATPKDKGTTIYNPMLLGIYYNKGGSDNSMEQGLIDANTNWNLNSTEAWAKKIEPTIKKEIENPYNGNNKGADQAVGETFNFKVTALIPGYSKEYTNVKYIITDKLSEGLDYNDDSIKVTVNGQVVQEGENTFKFTKTDDQNIKIDFNSNYILENGGKEVIVTYSAKLNEKAKEHINFDPNTNDVTLEYSNSPDINKDGTKINDRTYQYTFGIDANLNGSRQDKNKKTREIIKVNENGEVLNKKVESETETGQVVTGPLAGAKFELKPINGTPGETLIATSDDSGKLSFTGLATGDYELKEIEAPSGYALNNEVQKVKITATYNPEGTLKTYSITINDQNTSTYTATYEQDGSIKEIKDETKTSIIKNTKLSQLPSTGGIGTYIFTFVGVTLMAGAIGSHFLFGKKKSRV